MVTPDEVPNPHNLAMRARINGEEVSYGHTKVMYWTFEQMIAYVSQSETLFPGEFFGSGTGTVLESGKDRRCCGLEVERLGTLTNYIVGQE